jgi:hypothetical protein
MMMAYLYVQPLHLGDLLVPRHVHVGGGDSLDSDPQGVPASEMNRLSERALVMSNG